MFALQTLAFPPKEWGRGTEPSTVDARKGALGKWTNEILNGSANDLIADPAIEKELLMFLAPSEGDDAPQSHPSRDGRDGRVWVRGYAFRA